MTVNVTRTGSIEAGGDKDWFAVSLVANNTYTISLNAASGSKLDPYLTVYDGSGSKSVASNDDSGGTLNSLVTYRPSSSGTYYIEARAFSTTSTGNYSLLVAGPAPAPTTTPAPTSSPGGDDYAANTGTSGSLTVNGSSVSGVINSGGDVDWFRVSLNAGTSYQFGVNGSSLTDPYGRLYNSSGTSLAFDDDSGGNLNSLVSYTPSTSGTYYFAASAFSSTATGSYTVFARTVGATPAPTTTPVPTSAPGTDDYAGNGGTTGSLSINGSSVSGRIGAAYDTDWFRVSLTAGTTYEFLVNNVSGLDPWAELYNSAGLSIAFDDDSGGNHNALLRYTPTTSGTYFIEASDYSLTATGNYTIQARTASGPASSPAPTSAPSTSDDYANNSATAGRVTVGSSSTGRIENINDHDWFAVSLTAGQTYAVSVTADSGSKLDPYLSIYNGGSKAVGSDNNSGGGVNALLNFTPASTGTYYIDVSTTSTITTNTGGYTVRVSPNASAPAPTSDDYAATTATAGSVAVGSSVTAQIETANDRDWFAVSLNAGQAYTFTLTKSGTPALNDPYLTVRNAAGTDLAHDDDSAGSLNSRVVFTPTSSGTYYLEARDFGTSTGNYVLSAASGAVSTPAPTTPPVTAPPVTAPPSSAPIPPGTGPTNANTVYVFHSERLASPPGSENRSETDVIQTVARNGQAPTFAWVFTSSPSERQTILDNSITSWPFVEVKSTFEAAHSVPTLSVPLFRFYSERFQTHFYTVSTAERDNLVATNPDWRLEGTGFNVYPIQLGPNIRDAAGNAAIPVYRAEFDDRDFNPSNGNQVGHYFTADYAEYQALVRLAGVHGNGIAFYGELPG